MPLLYVDLLGMKARYQVGGARAARRGYTLLGHLVRDGLLDLPEGRPVSGGVQSDAAALQFATATDAVIVGKAILRTAFAMGRDNRRVWIRGVVMSGSYPGTRLVDERQLEGAPPGVTERHFRTPLLRAVNAEQGGFRGQRLLIEAELVTPQLDAALGHEIGNGRVRPAHRLHFSQYPSSMDGFCDVLWPIPDDAATWPARNVQMQDRLRWSMRGGDAEALQAAATHLLFAEIDSIIHGLDGPAATAVG